MTRREARSKRHRGARNPREQGDKWHGPRSGDIDWTLAGNPAPANDKQSCMLNKDACPWPIPCNTITWARTGEGHKTRYDHRAPGHTGYPTKRSMTEHSHDVQPKRSCPRKDSIGPSRREACAEPSGCVANTMRRTPRRRARTKGFLPPCRTQFRRKRTRTPKKRHHVGNTCERERAMRHTRAMNKHPDAPTCSATQQRPQAVIIASERDDRMPNEEQDDTRSEAAEAAEEGRRNGERHS